MPLAWAGVGRREALQVGQQVSEEERIRRTVTEAENPVLLAVL